MGKTMVSGEDFPLNQSIDYVGFWQMRESQFLGQVLNFSIYGSVPCHLGEGAVMKLCPIWVSFKIVE